MWTFSLRWKEELVCECADGGLVVECTMGRLHVYFPTGVKWRTAVPAWASQRRDELLRELKRWCDGQNIPITETDDAWVYDAANA